MLILLYYAISHHIIMIIVIMIKQRRLDEQPVTMANNLAHIYSQICTKSHSVNCLDVAGVLNSEG